MRSSKRLPRYRCVHDALLLRASVRPDRGTQGPVWPDEDVSEDVAVWVEWIGGTWGDPVLGAAVRDASSVLAARIDAVVTGKPTTVRDARRAALALARYVLRLGSRPTPFGRFAGIAPAVFGLRTEVELDDEPRHADRVEAGWLHARVDEAERDPAVAPHLLLAVNDLCRIQGRRVMAPGPPAADAAQRPTAASIRLTAAVAFVLIVARSPISGAELAEKLASEFPSAEPSVISGMIRDLHRSNVLISCLRPPSTSTDPLGHVAARLSAIEPMRGGRLAEAALDAPRAVDTALGGSVEIVEPVACDLEDVLDALVACCRRPHGSAAWGEYLRRFYDRYGVGRLVPVAELIDPGTGLGLPDGFLGGAPEPGPKRTARDAVLLELAQRAALDGEREIELSDDLLARLAPKDSPDVQVPAHLELVVRINAESTAALDRGQYTLTVLGVGRSAGAMTGRFLHLLDPVDRERFTAAYTGLPTMDPDAVTAQLSFPPLHLRSDHVTRAEPVLPLTVSVGQFPEPGGERVALDDLAVGCDSRRLYLVSMSRDRPIEPIALTALRFDTHTPALVRFLAEVSTAQAAVVTGFDWGAATTLPYLPAVRRGRAILAPARWRLTGGELPDSTASYAQWAAVLAEWRARCRMPARVQLADGDQHLLLDLDEPMCAQVLRSGLERAGRVVLLEAPAPGANGWLGDRAHSVVVPLAARESATWPRIGKPSAHRVLGRSEGHVPGISPWLYARLPVPPDLQDHVIAEYLPALIAQLGGERRWWFMRYREIGPELRIRVALDEVEEFGHAAAVLGRWTAELKTAGLASRVVLDTYLPETGRWGDGDVLSAAEAVFHADSQAVAAHLRTGGKATRSALIAAGFTAIAAGFTGSTTAGMRWLIEHGRPSPPVYGVDRALLAETAALADPRDNCAAVGARLASPAVSQAWGRRSAALTAYRASLGERGGSGPDTVLTSLLHVHHIRAYALDGEHERLCRHLARATAQAFLHRSGGATP